MNLILTFSLGLCAALIYIFFKQTLFLSETVTSQAKQNSPGYSVPQP